MIELKYSYVQCERICEQACANIIRKYDGVYGIPKGGVAIAYIVSKVLNIPVLDEPTENTLVVDDIADTGRTIKHYVNTHDTMTLFVKGRTEVMPKFYGELTDNWIVFPWESKELPGEDAIVRILEAIGEDPTREGLLDTPKRVVKSWKELYGGYTEIPEKILKTTFVEGTCKEMVISKNIDYFSTCEHHMIPFYGRVHFGYIPNEKVVGISKIARLVEAFARRLQIQERMTTQIADTFMKVIQPKGCMVIVEGQHLCMSARGIKKQNSIMVTSAIRGSFEKPEVRSEFLSMIGGIK